jgi:DNA replication protein DnaC
MRASKMVPTSCSLLRPVAAKVTWRLQAAWRELALEAAITKLEHYDFLILNDVACVAKDQAETSVLFALIAARYERQSMLITADQQLGKWARLSRIQP